jgi:hypothetical protein
MELVFIDELIDEDDDKESDEVGDGDNDKLAEPIVQDATSPSIDPSLATPASLDSHDTPITHTEDIDEAASLWPDFDNFQGFGPVSM